FVTSITGVSHRILTSRDGSFSILSLDPGDYRVEVSAPRYQPQELQQVNFTVASDNRKSFLLRPLSDVWATRGNRNLIAAGRQAVLSRVGPDLGPGYEVYLETGSQITESAAPVVSTVLDPEELHTLPVAGNDAYSLLIALGGINSDAGSGRGLGLTVS